MKKNILICLEKLNIGGVETAVVNQATELKKRGNNVVILSKNGIYFPEMEKNGIKCIDFNFELKNQIDYDGNKKVLEIIEKFSINEIIIHQNPCILYVMLACMIKNIPYIAYVHTRTKDVFEWYEKKYDIYKKIFTEYFNNADKIIAITEDSKKMIKSLYNVEEQKILVMRNSINFEKYKSKRKVKKISKFLIISRLANEKIQSIQNAVDLFINYANKTDKETVMLDIYGDGNAREVIEEYIKKYSDLDYQIKIKGATSNVEIVMDEYDVVMAVGRCILEAISMKKLAIITGVDKNKFIVKPSNINDAINGNFASEKLPNTPIDEIVNELLGLNENDIENIVDNNYSVVQEKLNISNNVYTSEVIKKIDYSKLWCKYFDEMKKEQDEILKQNEIDEKNISEKEERLIKLETENKVYMQDIERLKNNVEEQNKVYELEIGKKCEELDKIYNSRRWIYATKIINIILRKKNDRKKKH